MGCRGAKGLGWKMHGTTTTNGHTAKYASLSLGWNSTLFIPMSCSYLKRTKMMIAIHYLLFWYIAPFLERIFSSDGFTGNYFGIVTGILAFHITQVLTQSTGGLYVWSIFNLILQTCLYFILMLHAHTHTCVLSIIFLLHGVYQSNGEWNQIIPSNTPIIGNFEFLHKILCNNQYWYRSFGSIIVPILTHKSLVGTYSIPFTAMLWGVLIF